MKTMKTPAVAVVALALAAVAPSLASAQGRPPGPTKGGIGATVRYKTAQEEYEALKVRAHGGDKLAAAELPDWSGVWTLGNGFVSFDPSLKRDDPQYGPLSKDNQAFYEKTLENVKRGVEWDQLSYCLPAGYPRWLSEPFLRDFALTPKVAFLTTEQNSEVRRVYTDGRGHVPEADAFPLWEGDSIGFWAGKGERATLVVWTNHIKAGDYHRSGPRYNDNAETVEQWTKIDDNTIVDEVTMYDPVGLTRPWHVSRRYDRVTTPGSRIDYWSCAENNNVVKTAEGATDFVLPGEKGYKDPDKLNKPPTP